MNSQDPELVAGRSCGPCSLCCKVSRVATLEKPAGKWCPHCAPGRGACMIHDVRPSECRNFHCSWLLSPELGPEWRPLTCKMVLIRRPHQILLLVDPGHPTAWRQDPYYTQLKEWSRAGVVATPRQQVLVYIKDRVIVVLPNKEVDLGPIAHSDTGDYIMVRELTVPNGKDWEAYVLPAKDVQSKQPGYGS
jgi:hypothetical protein